MSQVRRIHRWVIAGLAACLVAGMNLGSLPVAQAAPADVVTDFSLTATGPTTQLAGKPFTLNWSIMTNASSDQKVSKPVVHLTIPAGCVTSVNPSSVGGVTPQMVLRDGAYHITWTLSDITGGQSYQVPLSLTTSDGQCADQGKIPITAEVTDDTGATMPALNGSPLNLTTTTGDPTIKGSIPDMTGANNPDVSTVYGGKSPDGGKTLSTNPDDLSWVPISYASNWSTDPGGRDLESVVIRNALPEGALFDPTKNPGWTLSADGKSVERTIAGPIHRGDMRTLLEQTKLYLKFPGAATNTPMTNTVTIIGNPVNPVAGEKPYTATDSKKFQFTSQWAPTGILQKYGQTAIYDAPASRNNGVGYEVEVTNKATDAAMRFLVSDYTESSTYKPPNNIPTKNLDDRLYFDSLTFRVPLDATKLSQRWSGPVEILTCDNNGPATVIATVTVPSGSQTLNVPLPNGPSLTCVQVRGANGATIPPEQILTWTVNTKFRDASVSALGDGKPAAASNSAYIEASWTDDRPAFTGPGTAVEGWVPVQPYRPELQVLKDVVEVNGTAPSTSMEGAQVMIGNEVTWELRPFIYHAVPGLTDLTTSTIIDLLPPGFVYVPGSTTGYYVPDGTTQTPLPQPTLVDNYKGSGRQALLWQLPSIKPATAVQLLADLRFKTRVTGEVAQGTNRNLSYMTWTGDNSIVPGGVSLPDTYDLKNSGNTSARIPGDDATVVYAPPRALLTSKQVKGSQDTAFLPAPQMGTTDIANPGVEYLLRFHNNSIQDIPNLMAIDALPTPGDTTLSPNAQGVLEPRNSQAPIRLTGPIRPPASLADNFIITYTTDPVADRTAATINREATWVETVTDWSKVTAYRIQLRPGRVLAQGQIADFTVPAALASNDPSQIGKSSYNSFATSLNPDASTFFESTLIGVNIGEKNPQPNLVSVKTVQPSDGTTVKAGETVTYTLTLNNENGRGDAPIDLTDDLTGILDDATLNRPSLTISDPSVLGIWGDGGQSLILGGKVPAGKKITVTYTVTVKADGERGDGTLRNCLGSSCVQNPTPPPVPKVPNLVVAKTVDPASGTTVQPGQEVTYTLTLNNQTGTADAPVNLTDDLADLIDDAVVDQSSLTVSGPSVNAAISADGEVLGLSGTVPAGQTIYVTFKARVKPDGQRGDNNLKNCLRDSCVNNPVPEPKLPNLVSVKTVDPADGTMVEPGRIVTYTLTLNNETGEAPAPIQLTDDLADVLDDATVTQTSLTVTDPAVTAQFAADGHSLVLGGSVPAGKIIKVSFQVVVKADGQRVNDRLANCLGSSCVTNPVRPVPELPGTPRLVEVKTVEPSDGTTVEPGQRVTYTLSFSNETGTAEAPVDQIDDLVALLDDATLDQASLVVSDPAALAAQFSADGTSLSLVGSVPAGQVITVKFTVVVKADGARGDDSLDNCLGTSCVKNPVRPAPILEPHLVPVKTVDPADGTTVRAGDLVTYTLTLNNQTGTAPAPVALRDDASGVVDDADIDQASLQVSDPAAVGATWSDDGRSLVLNGSVPAGQVVRVTFQARVKADGARGDGNVRNCLGSSCVTNPTPPGEPKLVTVKTVDPSDGTTVVAGQRLTYTVRLSNEHGTAVAPVDLTDNLAGVLDDATLDRSSLVVSAPDAITAGFNDDGSSLILRGTVPIGQVVTVTFAVVVKADGQRGDGLVNNCLADSCVTNPTPPPPVVTPPEPTPTPTPTPTPSPTPTPTPSPTPSPMPTPTPTPPDDPTATPTPTLSPTPTPEPTPSATPTPTPRPTPTSSLTLTSPSSSPPTPSAVVTSSPRVPTGGFGADDYGVLWSTLGLIAGLGGVGFLVGLARRSRD